MAVTINGSTGVDYADGIIQKYGTGNDLEISHTSNLSTIKNTHANGLALRSDIILLQNDDGDHDYITTANEAGVALYHDNGKRAETYSDGFKIPLGGELYIDGNAASGHCQLIMTRSDRSWLMTNQTHMRFYTSSGNTDSPTSNVFQIDGSGNTTIGGSLTENSDVSLKENVVTIPNALSKVKQLRGVEFDKKESGEHEIGCIAQEVQSVLPDLVQPRNSEDPLLTLSYTRLTPVLIEAIKELTAKVETLETKVAALEAG